MQVQVRETRTVDRAGYQQLEEIGPKNPPPFSAPQDEIKAYNHFTQMIKKREENKPSVLAKFNKKIVTSSPTIQMIDQIFSVAIDDYKESLKDALDKDFKSSKNLSKRNYIVDYRDAVAIGAQRMTRLIPNIIIFRHISALALSLIGASSGIIFHGYYIKEKIALENSEHRQKWLNEVRILEAQRQRLTKRLIIQRVSVLTQDIEENPDLFNLYSIEELKALDQLYRCIDPDTPLLIQGKDVNKYTEMINADETKNLLRTCSKSSIG